MEPVAARSRRRPATSRITRAKGTKARHSFGSGNRFRFVVPNERHAAVEPEREIVRRKDIGIDSALGPTN